MQRMHARLTKVLPSYFGTAAEFCKRYIQLCTEKQVNVAPRGFLDFISDIENETFGLVGELVLNFLLAVHVQKL